MLKRTKKDDSSLQLIKDQRLDIDSKVDLKLNRTELTDLIISDLQAEVEEVVDNLSIKIDKDYDDITFLENIPIESILSEEQINAVKTFGFKLTRKSFSEYHHHFVYLQFNSPVYLDEKKTKLYNRTSELEFYIDSSKIPSIKAYIEEKNDLIRQLNAAREKQRLFHVNTKKMKNQVIRNLLNSSKEGTQIIKGLDSLKDRFRTEILKEKK